VVGEWFGVLIAIVSSGLGGTAAAVTRYLVVGSADPLTLSILRWGIGFLCVLPVALLLRVRWPAPALSTLPMQTMIVAALLGIEPLTARKTIGVTVAVLGICAALASGVAKAPEGAWRGELIMAGAVLCMAFYNVFSRPFIQRSSALGFLAVGMGSGALALVTAGLLTGRLALLASFGPAQWCAGIYLGVAGGALAFILWVMALQRASPTRVANTMTVNPVALDLLFGLVAVFAGIWIATTEGSKTQQQTAA
jgi:drug/metabolite transporter (DMT)-like permease